MLGEAVVALSVFYYLIYNYKLQIRFAIRRIMTLIKEIQSENQYIVLRVRSDQKTEKAHLAYDLALASESYTMRCAVH